MSKRTNTDNRRLMDRLVPDPRHGPILGLLATTYEFQPEFFETDLLPTLLGLGAWDDRAWTSRIAMEKHLAEMEAATLLLDARRYPGRPRSLRVEVVPVVRAHGGVLHAKVLLVIHEQAVRLVVGSANLTEPGYRRNREAVAVLTATERDHGHAWLILGCLNGFQDVVASSLTQGARQLLAQATERLASWQEREEAAASWFVWGGGTQPLWQFFLDRWPGDDRLRRIAIVSPFWSEEDGNGPLGMLLREMQTRDVLAGETVLDLVTEAAPKSASTYQPVLPESFRTLDLRSFGVSAKAYAVDPRVSPDEVGMGDEFTGTRALHAKVVLFEGQETSLAYLGSANFSHHGWGFLPDPSQANIEAGLVFRRTGRARRALLQLIPETTGDPVLLTGAGASRLALPESSPAGPPWPTFLKELVLSPSSSASDRLDLVVVVDSSRVDGPWALRMRGPEATAGPELLSMEPAETVSDTRRMLLDDAMLNHLLRTQEVLVDWWASEEPRAFPINVDLISRQGLPISPSGDRPGEHQLIAYYQGRITWEELFPDPDGPKVLATEWSDLGIVAGVDTSKIQSYQVREFVEALQGLHDDLKAAARASRACMRLALLGSVSPVTLARLVFEAAQSGDRTPTAAGFQLVEIIAILEGARRFAVAPRLRNDWQKFLGQAIAKVEGYGDSLRQLFPEAFTPMFRRYESTVRRHRRS